MSTSKKRINILDILVISIIASAVSLYFSKDLFLLVGGFTGILLIMYLVIIWDDIVIWLSTRRRR